MTEEKEIEEKVKRKAEQIHYQKKAEIFHSLSYLLGGITLVLFAGIINPEIGKYITFQNILNISSAFMVAAGFIILIYSFFRLFQKDS